MNMNIDPEERIIRDGKYKVKIVTHYLTDNRCGLKIEVRYFESKKNKTVEVDLIFGDGVSIIKQSLKSIVLQNPRQSEINKYVSEFKEYCIQNFFH